MRHGSIGNTCTSMNPRITVHSLLRFTVEGTLIQLKAKILYSTVICFFRSSYLESILQSIRTVKDTSLRPGSSCSKLMTSLVNGLLKFQILISDNPQYFFLKTI